MVSTPALFHEPNQWSIPRKGHFSPFVHSRMNCLAGSEGTAVSSPPPLFSMAERATYCMLCDPQRNYNWLNDNLTRISTAGEREEKKKRIEQKPGCLYLLVDVLFIAIVGSALRVKLSAHVPVRFVPSSFLSVRLCSGSSYRPPHHQQWFGGRRSNDESVRRVHEGVCPQPHRDLPGLPTSARCCHPCFVHLVELDG